MEPISITFSENWWSYFSNQHLGWIAAEFSIALQFGWAVFKKIASMTKTKVDDAIVEAAEEKDKN